MGFGGFGPAQGVFGGDATFTNLTVTGAATFAATVTATGQFLAGDGSAGAPAYSFTSDPDTGIHLRSAGVLQFNAGGVELLRLTGGGNAQFNTPIIFANDNSVDVGASGANRPRSIYVGTDVTAGGVVSAAGHRASSWGSLEVGVHTLQLGGTSLIEWSDTNGNYGVTKDLALGRNAAGVIEVNNGTPGTYRDLRLRALIDAGGAQVVGARVTGVAVDLAAIHAALVTHGLISA